MRFILRISRIYNLLTLIKPPHTTSSKALGSNDVPPELEHLSHPLEQTPLHQTPYTQTPSINKKYRKSIVKKLIQKVQRLNKSLHRLSKKSMEKNMKSFDIYQFYRFELPHYNMDVRNQVSIEKEIFQGFILHNIQFYVRRIHIDN